MYNGIIVPLGMFVIVSGIDDGAVKVPKTVGNGRSLHKYFRLPRPRWFQELLQQTNAPPDLMHMLRASQPKRCAPSLILR
eukprot:3692817-Amphidinium_carterae.1